MRMSYSEAKIEYLLTGEEPKEEDAWWEIFAWEAVRPAWEDLRDELLADWILDNPGRRPWGWWEFDAPRWERKFDAYWDGTLPEPRQRLGGKGTPAFEALAYVPSFTRGIPDSWVSDFGVSYYNGRAVDVHGNRIGTEYAEGNFPHDAIDPADPPRYESLASFLDRHGFLSAAERKALLPDAFDPEKVQC